MWTSKSKLPPNIDQLGNFENSFCDGGLIFRSCYLFIFEQISSLSIKMLTNNIEMEIREFKNTNITIQYVKTIEKFFYNFYTKKKHLNQHVGRYIVYIMYVCVSVRYMCACARVWLRVCMSVCVDHRSYNIYIIVYCYY